ncbi:hypothetical protein D3Y57_17125 [Sphingomonas paeninsulae]|uniref:Uncharacterized protein n=1 Tax=Sphingomonas paeninsulae TaxID=2319844 RepID=A0A494TCY8_SPHPE|nr:hypothetical protein [Sphingomonas paeninsulae]AYJ87337.1 hypothetical protein D3Y57_17125 [Sphingomonas paeninsulae]
MLVTFLGLVSASILPTISLLIGSMTASGRSVSAVDDLEREIGAAMDALLLIFGSVGIAVVALVMLATAPPPFLSKIPLLTVTILPRLGQAVVVAVIVLIALRTGQIPAVLRRTLEVRHKIAVAEARRATTDRAPVSLEVRTSFSNHPDFGKITNLEDNEGREPH